MNRRAFLGSLAAPLLVGTNGFPEYREFSHTDAQGRPWRVIWTGTAWANQYLDNEWMCWPDWDPEYGSWPDVCAGLQDWGDASYKDLMEGFRDGWRVCLANMDTWNSPDIKPWEFPEVAR